MNLNPFEKKCSNCGVNISRDVRFCPKCGAAQDAATMVCGNCNNTVPATSKFCPRCGSPLSGGGRVAVLDSRWARREGDFAARVDVQDVKGFLKQELVVEPGANALLIINGESRGICPPGKYTLDTLGDRVGRALDLNWVHAVTAILTDIAPVELKFTAGGVFTKDPLRVGYSVRMIVEITNPVVFITTLMRDRRNYSLNDLSAYLEPEVQTLSEEWIGNQSLDGLANNLRLKDEYALTLEEGLQRTFKRNGLTFKDVRAIRFAYEHYDEQRRKREEYLLQVTAAEAELEKGKRLAGLQDQLELQKLAAETREVERYEQRAQVMDRMRKAVLSDKFSELKSEEEMDTFLREQDKRALLADREIEELKRTWAEERQDTERARAHLLAKLDVERKYELDVARLRGDHTLRAEQLDFEQQIARKKADLDLDMARRRWEEELKIESDKQRIALDRAKTQVEIERLQRSQDRDDAIMGMELLSKMKEIRRLDEEERLRIQREHDLLLQKAKWEQQLHEFELQERQRAAERDFELKRLVQLSTMSAEALIAIAPKEQAGLLADLKRTEALKGMTDDQILALAAEKSPEIARAFQEKYRAIADGKASEREREMYERLLSQKDKSAEEVLRHMREMSKDQKELAESAMQRIVEASRGQGAGTPVIVTQPGQTPVTVLGGVAGQFQTATGHKNCPQCGVSDVNRDAAFCPNCGYKFPGGK